MLFSHYVMHSCNDSFLIAKELFFSEVSNKKSLFGKEIFRFNFRYVHVEYRAMAGIAKIENVVFICLCSRLSLSLFTRR